MPLKRWWFEACALGVALALLGVMGFRLAQAHGLLLADGQPLFGDFLAFWSAGRLALEGHADLVHNVAAIQGANHEAIPDLKVVATWNSPPTFLLLVTPFALLPYPIAAISFLLLTGGLYLYAARRILPGARAMLFAVTLPAALFHLGSVQALLLLGGVSALALHWLDERPIAAGAAIAVLTVKPHLALLWPIYLLITQRWRALGACILFTLLFMLTAGLVFGFGAWLRFAQNLSFAQDLISQHRVMLAAYASLYGNLLALGVPQNTALGLHALSAAGALACALFVFWRKDASASAAALMAATLLISPYMFFYDALLLAVGAAFLWPARGKLEIAAMALAWTASLSLTVGTWMALPIAPAIAWFLLITAMRRSRSVSALPAPAPRM